MKNKKITQFLQSFVAIPLFAATMPLAGISAIAEQTVVISKEMSQVTAYLITPEEAKTREEQARAIDDYFKSKDAPLAGYGKKFVEEAIKNDLDYRLLPAIAMRETTGGKFTCKNPKAQNNSFGWGSCKMGFKSVDHSIEHIAMTLGGDNPRARVYKAGMTITQILNRYNPESIMPGYANQVKDIMNAISDEGPIK
jgi:hypothetical protein